MMWVFFRFGVSTLSVGRRRLTRMSMEYRSLGQSGLRVSVVGLGTNNFGRTGTHTAEQSGVTAVLRVAHEHGVTLIDTADIYGATYGLSETLLGEALRGRRDDFVVATKFGHAQAKTPLPNWGARGSRRYIRLAVEGSLRRLQTDWIDLYQMHTPDPLTPISETLGALDELVREGKVRYIGSSNFAGWQIADADHTAARCGLARFISAQNEYNLLVRGAEREVLPAAQAFGVGFLPWYPLANGLLTGAFGRDVVPPGTRIDRERRDLHAQAPWDRLDAFRAFTDARGVSMLAATFGWLANAAPTASIIAGATRPEQIAANATAGVVWRPSLAETAEIATLFT